MTKNRFINQYLVSRQPTEELKGFSLNKVGDYYLYSHPSLEISIKKVRNSQLILLGYCFDYRSPENANQKIVDTIEIEKPLADIIKQLNPLSGVYVVIWKTENDIFIIPDMCALREVYFQPGAAASSPVLLGLINPLQESDNLRKQAYYRSQTFKSILFWVGDETSFKEIKRLKGNHYLNLNRGSTERFFPVQKNEPSPVNEAAGKAGIILSGILTAVEHRGPFMMGLTGGWDSRVLLSASRNIREAIIYCFYSHKNSGTDLYISKKLAHSFDLNYLQLQYAGSVKARHYNRVSQVLPNVNFKYPGLFNTATFFSSMINVNGAVSEIARTHFGGIKNLTGQKLAQFMSCNGHPYPAEVYDEWIRNNDVNLTKAGYSTLDFFIGRKHLETKPLN